VAKALANVARGGYPEALARIAFLLARKGEPLPLSRFEMKQQMMKDYAKFLPELPRDEARRIRGEQEVILGHARDEAIDALPKLLATREDRERLLGFVERLLADRRIQALEPSAEQKAMLARIRSLLEVPGSGRQRKVAAEL
jgi:hypothetical protein